MNLEDQMNGLLEKMGIALRVVWLPSDNAEEHARILPEESLIMVYDRDEHEAFHSLFHECLEYRFRSLITPYREVINKLIETIESLTYKEKEKVLAQIMTDFSVWKSFEETSGSTDGKAGKKGE